MPILSTETYNNIKDYLHPNLHKIIKEDKLKDDKLVCLPPFHGCRHRNKNGTKKLIDYSRGYRCIMPSWRRLWKKNVKDKYSIKKYPKTRYRLNSEYRNLFKNKGNYVYNYELKKYQSIKEPVIKDFFNQLTNGPMTFFWSKPA